MSERDLVQSPENFNPAPSAGDSAGLDDIRKMTFGPESGTLQDADAGTVKPDAKHDNNVSGTQSLLPEVSFFDSREDSASDSQEETAGQSQESERAEPGEGGEGEPAPSVDAKTNNVLEAIQDDDGDDFQILKKSDVSPKKAAADGAFKPFEREGDSPKSDVSIKTDTTGGDGKTENLKLNKASVEKFMSGEKPKVDVGSFLSKDKPVFLLGEEHTDAASQEFVASQAKEFARQGVTHFGAEVIPQSMQPTLDKFFAGDQDARNAIKDHLNNTWNVSYPGSGEKYMAVLDAMKSAGIKPIALDSHGHFDTVSSAGGGGQRVHDQERADARDRSWADAIAKTIKDNPDARMLVMGGADHFTQNKTATDSLLEKTHGIKSTVGRLVGGDQKILWQKAAEAAADPTDRLVGPGVLPFFARRAGVAEEAFQARVDRAQYSADVFIHTPQRKKP